MATQILVRLKNQDVSLSCPYTGWTISRSQQMLTPKSHSPRILEWLRVGALIPVAHDGSIMHKFRDLLNGDPMIMSRETVVEVAREICRVDPHVRIETKERTRDQIGADIIRWREGKADVVDDGDANVLTGMGPDEAAQFVDKMTDLDTLRSLGAAETRKKVLQAIDDRIEALEAVVAAGARPGQIQGEDGASQ